MQDKYKKYFLYIFLVIVFVSSSCIASAAPLQDRTNIDKYLSSEEESIVLYDKISAYSNIKEDSSEINEILKGDRIKVVQPVNKYGYKDNTEIIVNDENICYIEANDILEKTQRQSDSLLFKIYKNYCAYTNNLSDNITMKKLIILNTVFLAVLLIDPLINKMIKKIRKTPKVYPIVRCIVPGTLIFVTIGVSYIINQNKLIKVLMDGIGFLPQGTSLVHFVIYFSAGILVFGNLYVIYKLFKIYALIIGFLRIIETAVLDVFFAASILHYGFIMLVIFLIIYSGFAIESARERDTKRFLKESVK